MRKISHRKIATASIAILISSVILISSSKLLVEADSAAQTLPFSQDWSNTSLITMSDLWTGVPGIEGFRGDGLTGGTGVDPQTVLAADDPGVLDVNANQANPNTFATGGVAEFDTLPNPTIALQGSGTARAPYIKLYLNTTGQSSINISYNLRDVDGSADNAVQPVALQFRVGSSGTFTNVPAGFVADATTGPSLATLVTPVSATLPAAAENQSLVQVRIIITDAVGSDEWVGIDNIVVTGVSGGSTNPSGAGAASPSNVIQGGSTLLTVTVTPGTNPASIGLAVTGDLTSIGGSATQTFFDDGTNGDVAIGDNIFSFQATVAPATPPGAKSLPVAITDSQMRAGNTAISLTITPPAASRIHDIQGASHTSLYLGFTVSNIPGIVTALRTNGFFMQDPLPDSNDATSEGIFVFTSSAPMVAVGDAVSVSGAVAEFGSSPNLTNTEIGSPTTVVTSTGNVLPAPTVIGTGGRIPPTTIIDDDSSGTVGSGPFDPDNDGIDFYESLEGMRIQVNNAVAVGPRTSANEIAVIGDNGANASVRTSRGGIVIRANDFNPERIIIDDTLLAGSTPAVNVGDTFTTPVVGIMDYSGGNFRLLTTSALTAVSGGLMQESTIPQGTNEVAIATFNVENLDPSDGATKFNTLASLIVNNLKSPDIICVEEVQDNDGPANSGTVDASVTYGMLISAVQAAGGPTYQVRQINPVNNQDGGEPSGNIRQIFMFRTDRGVAFIDRPGGGSIIATTVVSGGSGPELSSSPGRIDPANPAFNNSRKPLAGEFTFNGHKLFLIGNHFNSKGGDDPLYGRNQPPIRSSETARIQQAQIVNNFVDSILALDANADIVVLGDLNDFEFSTAINTLKGGVLTPLIESLPQNERYSYNFEGNAQVLDHIMASNNLFNNVPFVYDVVHINSEFAVQSSDHDPSVARFTSAPTAAKLASFEAESYGDQVLLRWQTGEEIDNLGFNIYREENGERVRLNPQLLAGSALLAGNGIELKAGRSYSWWDGGRAESRYWLEEISLNGDNVLHGPVKAKYSNGRNRSAVKERQAVMLSMLGRDQLQFGITRPVEPAAEIVQSAEMARIAAAQFQSGLNLAAQKAVKISVNHEGWYRVAQPELVRVGIDPKVDPRMLQLFVDGKEQPISVTGKNGSDFGPSDAIEFYGIGLDTASTNSRVYWLIAGSQPGLRVQQVRSAGGQLLASSFPSVVERRDRTIYFSSLRNGDKENFFGAVVTRDPIDQTVTLERVDARSAGGAVLELALQGVSQKAHRVNVLLNGSVVGEASFEGQTSHVARLPISQALLKEGDNVVRLAAQGTEFDVSLIDYIRLTYQRSFTATNNTLRFSAASKQLVTVDGFTASSIRVFDVTSPDAVQEVAGLVKPQKNGFAVTVAVPGSGPRTLLALTSDQAQRPPSVTANQPSNWRQPNQGADLVIVTHSSLVASAGLLKTYRESQGLRVALIDIEDVYDEFAFGNKSPYALRDLLAFARANWQRAPRFVLLVGDASLDPRNYLGRGDFDLVPTKLLDTQFMETASDDWFAEVDSNGSAGMSVGRLPVRAEDEAARMVSKIMGYEQSTVPKGVLLVSDINDGFNFEVASDRMSKIVPDGTKVEKIYRGMSDESAAKKALLDGLSRGQKIVNYAGHASVDSWRGNLLSSAEARGLTNGEHLPVFVMLTCLNGYFHDVSIDSLAESLMKAERGGAVAVWASSGLTVPSAQSAMDEQAFRALFSGNEGETVMLGEITSQAKAAVHNLDVRRTWILFGDPTTRIRR
ncbi:MAG TPA: C25 family cysteine peptidase [Blastocatellia bacterium]|nr:C25 family cysteine peptidase [Blastocatellia bacterium]